MVVFSLLRHVWWKIEFFRVLLSMIPFFTFIYLKCFNSLCLCCTYLCEVMCVFVGICVPRHTYRGHPTTLGVSSHLVFSIVSCQFCLSKFWAIPCLCFRLTVVVVESWTHTATDSFTVFWESELRSLHLHAKYDIHWATSTAPFYIFVFRHLVA